MYKLLYEAYLDNIYGCYLPLGPKTTWDEQAQTFKTGCYPTENSLIPSLLRWLQDLNWPGAIVIADHLVQIGEPLLKYLPEVFASNDEDWIENVIFSIVEYWPLELQEKVKEIAHNYEVIIPPFITDDGN